MSEAYFWLFFLFSLLAVTCNVRCGVSVGARYQVGAVPS